MVEKNVEKHYMLKHNMAYDYHYLRESTRRLSLQYWHSIAIVSITIYEKTIYAIEDEKMTMLKHGMGVQDNLCTMV